MHNSLTLLVQMMEFASKGSYSTMTLQLPLTCCTLGTPSSVASMNSMQSCFACLGLVVVTLFLACRAAMAWPRPSKVYNLSSKRACLLAIATITQRAKSTHDRKRTDLVVLHFRSSTGLELLRHGGSNYTC